MRFNVAAIIAGAAILAAFGCGNSGGGDTAGTTTGTTGTTGGAATNTGGKKLRIAVIPKGATHEFWKAIHAGANKAGEEFGAEVEWKAPEKEDDREGQQRIVDTLVQEKVDGIVLAPLDDAALAKPAKEAIDQGIPVIIIDSGLKETPVSSFIATDNYKGGQMAGQEMAKLLGDKGRIVVIRYQAGSASTEQREAGFLDEIKKHANIKVVSADRYAGATVDSAQKEGENVLSGLKKADGSLDIDGLYTPNESSTFGLLRVLQGNNWAGKIKFVGFDSSAKLVEALDKGELDATIVQNPFKMGYLGVKTMVDVIHKKKVEEKIDTGATLVTKENMNQDEIKKLLNPPGA
ncbi:substrate-binding domain-containing protein [Fimbriimonas ginsengisoli]|uniref:D-ribose-binding periplasmic protein n=1 Tax=Fimbriimonas ginsengisoli Gsoil 348 TaxID=661478 RepID=A0A068NZ28_FIMGI|nr:substrate-binding domain-containing protein [Fimbriimonas ginsengisoli]AIE87849.1 D-ribose-binding periplasmic protein [Fimbriimonas ginsengisoli Gsoil 348]